jgi:hypothetical protein
MKVGEQYLHLGAVFGECLFQARPSAAPDLV